MSQNSYQPSTITPSSPAPRPFRSADLLGSIVGSIVLVLLGIAVAGLGILPSDAPGLFLLTGTHLIACGTLALASARINKRHGVRHVLCWASIIVNAALVVRLAFLIGDGTVRGPLILAAPLPAGT